MKFTTNPRRSRPMPKDISPANMVTTTAYTARSSGSSDSAATQEGGTQDTAQATKRGGGSSACVRVGQACHTSNNSQPTSRGKIGIPVARISPISRAHPLRPRIIHGREYRCCLCPGPPARGAPQQRYHANTKWRRALPDTALPRRRQGTDWRPTAAWRDEPQREYSTAGNIME